MGVLYFQQRIAGVDPHYVSVLTLSGLDAFLDEAVSVATGLHKVFAPDVKRILKVDHNIDLDAPRQL